MAVNKQFESGAQQHHYMGFERIKNIRKQVTNQIWDIIHTIYG